MARLCAFFSTIGRRFASAPGLASMSTKSAAALVAAPAAVGHADPVFELVEGPAGRRDACPGRASSTRRVPVRVLNLAWHRLGWPPVERFAGPDRHRPLGASAPDAGPRREAGDHHLRSRLPRPSRADARGNPARLRDAGAAPHARRAAAVVTISRFTAGEIERRLGVPRDRIVICSPGAPDWKPRAAAAPRGPILFMGTLEPRKNIGALLAAYAKLREMDPAAPAALARGRRRPRRPRRGSAPSPSRRLKGHVTHLGYVAQRRPLRSLRAGVDAGAALSPRRLRDDRARSDDRRRAGDRQPPRRAAGSGRRRRADDRARRRRRGSPRR